jgi:hypothetical protein
MSNRPARITQAEIERAIRAANKANCLAAVSATVAIVRAASGASPIFRRRPTE